MNRDDTGGSGSAATGSMRRLAHERKAAEQLDDEHVLDLRPISDDDLQSWRAILHAPVDGMYKGGYFEVHIQVPETYPTKPPTMHFRTRIFHPNVHWKTGEICLDVLKTQWSPAWSLHSACTAVVALLDSPEADSPLNVDAANLLRTGDHIAYRSMCAMYTRLYAGTTGP